MEPEFSFSFFILKQSRDSFPYFQQEIWVRKYQGLLFLHLTATWLKRREEMILLQLNKVLMVKAKRRIDIGKLLQMLC